MTFGSIGLQGEVRCWWQLPLLMILLVVENKVEDSLLSSLFYQLLFCLYVVLLEHPMVLWYDVVLALY